MNKLLEIYLSYLNEINSVEKWIAKKVLSGDKTAIRNYINRLLGSRYYGKRDFFINSEFNKIAKIFHNPKSTAKELGDIAIKIDNITKGSSIKYNYGKKLTQSQLKNKLDFLDIKRQTKDLIKTTYKFKNKNPDGYVTITHGGGRRHLDDFLKGRSIGYDLEKGGKGIEVSPQEDLNYKSDRAYLYARRAAKYHLDDPAIMTAKIKRKYLLAANNEYEAGLPPENVKYLKDIQIKDLPKDDIMDAF